jgi:FixJ family two-component response regulator
MIDSKKQHIFFVDDEPKIREVVCDTLEGFGYRVSCFTSGADCLARLVFQRCDLLITDVKMPGMDGIELMKKAKNLAPWLPVLLITDYGDIPMAVNALKAGAVNFIEKPLNRRSLLLATDSALKRVTLNDPVLLGRELTKAEMRVLRLLLEGNSNKEAATLLHRSTRTVEWHRNRIMRKLGTDNLFDLFRRATAMGLLEP